MLCMKKILTPLPSENSGEVLSQQEKLRLRAAMVLAADGLRKLRSRKVKCDCYNRYHARHRDRLRAKRHTPEHRKSRAEYFRKWLDRNPEKKKKKRMDCLAYHNERYLTDPAFALARRMRRVMLAAFRAQKNRKRSKTLDVIGCPLAHAKIHIEKQFTNGMSWKRPRSFEVDHIIPISVFDLSNDEEVKWAFNWRNLQPLTPHENWAKHAKLPDPLPAWLPCHIADRIRSRRPARQTV